MAEEPIYRDDPAMNFVERERLINRYGLGYAAVAAAVGDCPIDELDHRPAPGAWTPREVVHHLADSESNAYIRLRRLLAEDTPLIIGYDQDLWANRLHYDGPIDAPLAVLRAVRDASFQLLGQLSDADWLREGTHSESGPYSVETWLNIYAAHAHDHADQILRARKGVA